MRQKKTKITSRRLAQDVAIFNNCEQEKETLLTMVSKCSDMWDSHFGRNLTEQDRVELTSDKKRRLHSTPYQAGFPYRTFAAAEITRILRQHAMKATAVNWAILIKFTAKKCRSLLFCVDFRRVDVVNVRAHFSLRCMYSCIDSFRKAATFST